MIRKISILLFILCGIALPQLLISSYIAIISIWFLTGVLAGVFNMKIGLFIFSFQGILGFALYYLSYDRFTWIVEIVNASGWPSILVPAVFILFNAANVTVCFMLGKSCLLYCIPANLKSKFNS